MPEKTSQRPPATNLVDADALLAWYDRHARTLPWRVGPHERAQGLRADPYAVWLSEIMLQQTTVQVVGDYFHKFLTRWPTVEALGAAPLDDVLSMWAGLGYYARARNLHACAQMVAEQFAGVFPKRSDDLLALPGIGPYTAAAIAAICYDEQVAVLDGNVDRVMARFLALDVPVRDAKPYIRQEVQRAVPKRAGDFAQAMMDLGASLCAPRSASCMLCPLQTDCAGAAMGAPTSFPVKPVKAERPVRYGHAYIMVRADGAIWLRQRPAKGLLAKMTEVPGSNWDGVRPDADFPLVGDWAAMPDVVHVFTHFRLELNVWRLPIKQGDPPGAGWWATPDEVVTAALPSLFRKVLASGQKEKPPG